MHEKLLAGIEVLYDCVGEDYDQARALQTYSSVADDSGVFLTDIQSRPLKLASFDFCNIPEESAMMASAGLNRVEDNLILQLFPILPERVPTPIRTFISDEEYQNSIMYQKASKPWGLHSEAVCVLSRGADMGKLCGFLRHKNQDEIDPELYGLLTIFGNHMHRSMSLQRRIDKLEETLIQSNNILDLIEFGLVLYGTDRTPLFVNVAAQRILDSGDGLRLLKNDIAIGDRHAENQYQALLDSIYRPGLLLSQKAGGIITASRHSESRPYSLIVVPMRSFRADMENVTAAVFLFDPDVPKTTAIELFVSSYGLTQTEAELAHYLALGGSLEEISEQRGVSRNTVKTQLQSIFAKTETNRQSELVSLLLRSVVGINLKTG